MLRSLFVYAHNHQYPHHCPPIFLFGSTGQYHAVQFLGFAVPRGGELFLFSDKRVEIELDNYQSLTLDDICPTTVPLQLLSCHVALLKGTGVDQPRNLAKSVTVE